MAAAIRMTTVPTRSQSHAQWITTVAEELGTDDLEFAHRVLRSWLWMIREREARPAAYTIRFARNARIAVQDVRAASSAVTAAMMRLLPPAVVDNLLDELDPGLQMLVRRRVS